MKNQSNPHPLMLNEVVPDFTLDGLDGRSIKLSDYRGRKTIVFMWASW